MNKETKEALGELLKQMIISEPVEGFCVENYRIQDNETHNIQHLREVKIFFNRPNGKRVTREDTP